MAEHCKLDQDAVARGRPALPETAVRAYQEDGVLIIEDFAPRKDCESGRCDPTLRPVSTQSHSAPAHRGLTDGARE